MGEILFSSVFAKYEIILVILSFVGIVWIYATEAIVFFRRAFFVLRPKRKSEKEVKNDDTEVNFSQRTIQTDDKKDQWEMENSEREQETELPDTMSESIARPKKREEISTLLSLIRTRLARGETQEAKAKIVEWLSLNKDHRELNLLLGEAYEIDGDYKRAEIIYKDLVPLYGEDREIYQKLGESLMKQEKYEIAYDVYSKLLSFTKNPESVVFPLAFASYHLGKMDEVLQYGKQYLRNHPYDPDTLWIVAQAEIALGDTDVALERLQKLRQLSPYNEDIFNMIQTLQHPTTHTEDMTSKNHTE